MAQRVDVSTHMICDGCAVVSRYGDRFNIAILVC